MKEMTFSQSKKTNPNKANFKGCIINKSMNIEVADPAFRGRNQSSIEPFVVSLCPVSRESISICKIFAASKYTAAAEGTTTASLRISNRVPAGQFRHRYKTPAPTSHIRSVATSVFANVTGNPSNMCVPSRLRSMKIRIKTCKYEQIAVESANPATPINQIRVRLRITFTSTAIIALRIGALESCIE